MLRLDRTITQVRIGNVGTFSAQMLEKDGFDSRRCFKIIFRHGFPVMSIKVHDKPALKTRTTKRDGHGRILLGG